jgi:hypothetical protein
MAGVVGTYNWKAIDAVETSRWWIMAASKVDSSLAVRPEHLDTLMPCGSLAGGSPTSSGPPPDGEPLSL